MTDNTFSDAELFGRYEDLFDRLKKSKFRSSFHLKDKDKQYVLDKGMELIKKHAFDLIDKKLADAFIDNDGRQTPTKGHPVFIAQHATACCCRGCLEKWHHIKAGRTLTEQEKSYIVDILLLWIKKEMLGYESCKTENEYEQLKFDL